MGHNGCLSLRKLGKSVKVQNFPYPFLRGQPLNYMHVCVSVKLSRGVNKSKRYGRPVASYSGQQRRGCENSSGFTAQHG